MQLNIEETNKNFLDYTNYTNYTVYTKEKGTSILDERYVINKGAGGYWWYGPPCKNSQILRVI